MRRSVILVCDIIAAVVVFEWTRLGPWNRLLGFTYYHSRGDVWLPTPPAAADYFRAMVSTGTLFFVIFFLFISLVLYAVGSRGEIVHRVFYGDARKLSVKYFAFLLISFLSPLFYNRMWRYHLTRSGRIEGGLAITIAVFIVVLIVGELLAHLAPRRQQVSSR